MESSGLSKDNFKQFIQNLKDKVISVEGRRVVLKEIKELFNSDSINYNSLLVLLGSYDKLRITQLNELESQEYIDRRDRQLVKQIYSFLDNLKLDDFAIGEAKSDPNKKTEYKKGHLLTKIPKKMQQLKETKCIIRMAFEEFMVEENLVMDKDSITKSHIRIANRMKVEIFDRKKNFEIDSTINAPIQFIGDDSYTEWIFYVKPIAQETGIYPIVLKITIIEFIDGEHTVRNLVVDEEINIVSENVKDHSDYEDEKRAVAMILAGTSNVLSGLDSINPSSESSSINPEAIPSSSTPIPPIPVGGGSILSVVKSITLGLSLTMMAGLAGYLLFPDFQNKVKDIASQLWGNTPTIPKQNLELFAQEKHWNVIKNGSYNEALDFLQKYKDSEDTSTIRLALERIELLEWQRISDMIDSPDIVAEINQYLKVFVGSNYEKNANKLLQNLFLKNPSLKSQLNKVKSLPDGNAIISKIIKKIRAPKIGKILAPVPIPTPNNDPSKTSNKNQIAYNQTKQVDALNPITDTESRYNIDPTSSNYLSSKRLRAGVPYSINDNIFNTDLFSNNDFTKSIFIDSRDNQSYPIMSINEKWWFTRNLNYHTLQSQCYSDQEDCSELGQLYNWNDAKTACPEGWRLPSEKEWSDMLEYLFDKNKNCSSCFDALVEGGEIGFDGNFGGFQSINKKFHAKKYYGYYWSGTEENSLKAKYFVFSQPEKIVNQSSRIKTTSYSCRCIKDTFSDSVLVSIDSTVNIIDSNLIIQDIKLTQFEYNDEEGTGLLTDKRANQTQTYPAIKVNGKWWMAKNLNIHTSNSFSYDNKNQNTALHGRLYTWDSAITACPAGWQLPTLEDWESLIEHFASVGDNNSFMPKSKKRREAYKKLITEGNSGFNATLSGQRKRNEKFDNLNNRGIYWTITPKSKNKAWNFTFNVNPLNDEFHINRFVNNKDFAHSCRCIKIDETSPK